MVYVGELGGYVSKTNEFHETSIPGVYVAGDVGGIEEASSAMVEGYLTGLYVNKNLGVDDEDMHALIEDYHKQLSALRSGPVGDKIRAGLSKTKL
jgi:sarcosine oxidase subunit alpha